MAVRTARRLTAGAGERPAVEPIDIRTPEFVEVYDELSLWAAPFARLMLERVPLRRGAVMLDVGAGAGWLSIELAERCGRDSRMIAVDPWTEALARLRRKRELLGLDHLEIVEGDAAALDLPDRSVDLVVSNLGINNFEDPDAVLAVCFRVARPGACLLLTTNLIGHMEEFYGVFRATLEATGHADRVPALEAHVAHRGTVASVSALLARAGFEVTSSTEDRFRMRFADGHALLGHHFIRAGFLPDWLAVAGDDADGIMRALARELDAVAAARGELALTIPIACIEARRPA